MSYVVHTGNEGLHGLQLGRERTPVRAVPKTVLPDHVWVLYYDGQPVGKPRQIRPALGPDVDKQVAAHRTTPRAPAPVTEPEPPERVEVPAALMAATAVSYQQPTIWRALREV